MEVEFQLLTEEMKEKLKANGLSLTWFDISRSPGLLSEDYICKNCDNLFWPMISKYQYLSEDLIRLFNHRIDWKLLCKNKFIILSEEFLEEMGHPELIGSFSLKYNYTWDFI